MKVEIDENVKSATVLSVAIAALCVFACIGTTSCNNTNLEKAKAAFTAGMSEQPDHASSNHYEK